MIACTHGGMPTSPFHLQSLVAHLSLIARGTWVEIAQNPAQFASLPLWRLRVAVIISAVSLSTLLTSAMPALVYFSSCFIPAGSRLRLDISSVYHSRISYVTFLSYISVYSDLCLLFITTTKCYGAAHAWLPIMSTEYPTTRTNTYRAAPFHVIPYIGKRYVVT